MNSHHLHSSRIDIMEDAYTRTDLLVKNYSSTKKLKCISVGNDEFMLELIQSFCQDSTCVQIVNAFRSPKEFISLARTLDFDICIIDIHMTEMDGLMVAQLLGNKPVIFITGVTGVYENIKDALELAPIDIVPKPLRKERLNKAFERASILIETKNEPAKEYDLFNIAESTEKIKLRLSDIIFAKVDEVDPRNKQVVIRNGNTYTLMDYTFNRILSLCSNLIQVNRTELVSREIIHKVKYDLITLAGVGNTIKQVTLSYTFRKEFHRRMSC